jgi:hypothetical protein
MKILRSIAAASGCAIFLITPSFAETQSLSIPLDFQFLNQGNSPIDGLFLVRGGQVFVTGADGIETSSPLGPLSGAKGTSFSGAAETILGAPVVVFTKREVVIPDKLLEPKGSSSVKAVALSDTTLFVREVRMRSTEPLPAYAKQIITEFIVSQLANGKLSELGSFSFHENTFNQYLSEVWPISNSHLAIVTRSSRHSKLNTLFIFDVKKHQLVGMREFSLLQYLPATTSVWIAQSVANCDNIEDVFADAKRNAQVHRLFEGNEISCDFQSLDGMDGDIARKAQSASTVKSPSAALPMASPKTSKEFTKSLAPTPSEKPTSSTLRSVMVILIVASILGIVFYLFRRKSE